MQHALSFEESDKAEIALPKVGYDHPADFASWNGIVLVGEAPGAEEARLGHPFVGRSGQLLDKILLKAGIERKKCLIANVFRMQPPGNKIDHFFLSRRKAKQLSQGIAENFGPFGSTFCNDDYAPEIEFLRNTIYDYREKRGAKKLILVALGRTPLWALTGKNGLLEKIGKPIPSKLVAGLTVIPTFHPSFILRGNWARQDEWLGHFALALQYLT